MKKRRVLAGLMGALAAVGAVLTLQLGLTAPGKETAVLKMDPRVMEQAQGFLEDLSTLDLEGASAYILGCPKLTAGQEGEGPEKLLWERYWQGLSCSAEGAPYAKDGNLAVDVRVSYPDIAAMTQQTGILAEQLLQQRVDQAESVSEVYDGQGYRQEILDEVLLQAVETAAEQVTQTRERNVVLELTYEAGNWWVVPGNELRDLLSGALDEG